MVRMLHMPWLSVTWGKAVTSLSQGQCCSMALLHKCCPEDGRYMLRVSHVITSDHHKHHPALKTHPTLPSHGGQRRKVGRFHSVVQPGSFLFRNAEWTGMRKCGVVLRRCERSSEKAFSAEDIKPCKHVKHTHTRVWRPTVRLCQALSLHNTDCLYFR